jgi:hypothetical protein
MKKKYKFKIPLSIIINGNMESLSWNEYWKNGFFKKTSAPKSFKSLLAIVNSLKFHHNRRDMIKTKLRHILRDQLDECPTFNNPVKIKFQMFKWSNHKSDKSNYYSVLNKIFYDMLQDEGIWEDDNDTFIKQETMMPTKKDENITDRTNYAYITITEI